MDVGERVKKSDCGAEVLEAKEFVQGKRLEIVHDIPDASDMPMTRQERSHKGLKVFVVEMKSAFLARYTDDLG